MYNCRTAEYYRPSSVPLALHTSMAVRIISRESGRYQFASGNHGSVRRATVPSKLRPLTAHTLRVRVTLRVRADGLGRDNNGITTGSSVDEETLKSSHSEDARGNSSFNIFRTFSTFEARIKETRRTTSNSFVRPAHLPAHFPPARTSPILNCAHRCPHIKQVSTVEVVHPAPARGGNLI